MKQVLQKILQKKKIRIACIAFLCLAACVVSAILLIPLINNSNESPTGNADLPSAQEIYQEAAENTGSMDKIQATVSCIKIVFTSQTFQEKANGTITYQNYGQADMQVKIDKTTKIGQYSIATTTFNKDDHTYLKVGNGLYKAKLDIQQFRNEFIPVIFFNCNNYRHVSELKGDGQTVIVFSEPTTIESWAAPQDAELVSATGNATIRKSKIVSCNYNLMYQYNGVTFQITYSAEISPTKSSIELTDIGKYVTISNLDAPLELERAYGYLMYTDNITASLYESIDCQTFGDNRNQSIDIITAEQDSKYSATLSIQVRQVSESWGGAVTKQTQNITYKDRIYKSKVNKEKPVEKTTITPEYMKSYCRDYLVGTIILPENITKVRISEDDGSYKYTFTLKDNALSERICNKASMALYSNDTSLDGLYKTDKLYAYISVDKHTGLPTASGIQYSGSHTLNDTNYSLTYKTGQTYKFQ